MAATATPDGVLGTPRCRPRCAATRARLRRRDLDARAKPNRRGLTNTPAQRRRSAAPGSRVRLIGQRGGGRRASLDDDVGLVVLDGGIDLDDLVAGHDGEAARVRANGLVFTGAQANEPVASDLAAFTPKHAAATGGGADRLVEPAKDGLVQGDASLRVFVGRASSDVQGGSHGCQQRAMRDCRGTHEG